LWCFGAATTASNAGSQVDGSKSVRSSAMWRPQLNGPRIDQLNSRL
jgi:hypothetical protein